MSDGRHTGSINPAAADGGMPGQYVSLILTKDFVVIILIVSLIDPTKMRSRSTIKLQETFKTSDSHHP